jgi:RHS repeat-associated protein
VTDYRGEVYEHLEYTPYGELWVEEMRAGGEKTPFRFTGKRLDEETGLYYYGARYLDPQTSRWLSTDPAMGEYIPSAPVNEEARKRNGNLPGMGGVFNVVNLHTYHYAGNNPVKYIDPDGRKDEDSILRKISVWVQEWEHPVITLGFSASATGPGISVGNSTGIYFVPKSRSDPIFYALLYALVNPVTPPVFIPAILEELASRSTDFGVFTDILSTGSGLGMSASIGLQIGIFRSMDDFRSFFNETGGSGGPPGVSIGGDLIFNSLGLPIGFSGTVGISIPGSTPEGHSRFGNTFVLQFKELEKKVKCID